MGFSEEQQAEERAAQRRKRLTGSEKRLSGERLKRETCRVEVSGNRGQKHTSATQKIGGRGGGGIFPIGIGCTAPRGGNSKTTRHRHWSDFFSFYFKFQHWFTRACGGAADNKQSQRTKMSIERKPPSISPSCLHVTAAYFTNNPHPARVM